MRFLASVAAALAGIMIISSSVPDAFASHDMPCNISIRTSIYDSEWRGVDRKSAVGQYYPGDGFNVLATWSAVKCVRFNIEPAGTHGNVVLRSMHEERMPIGDVEPFSNTTSSSPQEHFELKVLNMGTDDNPRYDFKPVHAGVPEVWGRWAEDDASKERFRDAVEDRCNKSPPEFTQLGCIYGHIELDTDYREDVCYETTDSEGKTADVCEKPVSKVVFTGQGEGTRCSHGEDGKCTRFTKTRENTSIVQVRQPNMDLILERDPFHDV